MQMKMCQCVYSLYFRPAYSSTPLTRIYICYRNVSTVEQANITRRQGYDLFAIGVGRNVNAKELLNIAGRHDRMFKFDSFDKLKHILDDLARKVGEGK